MGLVTVTLGKFYHKPHEQTRTKDRELSYAETRRAQRLCPISSFWRQVIGQQVRGLS